MFTPQELEKMPKKLEKIMSNLEYRVMQDIIRRIKENAEITRTADWQLYRLAELGKSKKEVKKYIQEALQLSNKEIDKLYTDVIAKGYSKDSKIYKKVGKEFIQYKDNNVLQQLVKSVSEQTKQQIVNITNTLGFVKDVNNKIYSFELTKYYQQTLDNAIMDITTGVFDYNTAIKRVVQEITKSGLRTIDYENGYNNRVEVATRRAVMTGVNQVVSKIAEDNAKQLDTEYFEVSAHSTARPTHQVWQGKVYTKQELETVCGLGKVDGLCGANCYHSYFPFILGISKKTYTDEQLDKWAKEENTPKKYGNKEYTSYEATQEQRRLERLMRKQRQDIKLLQKGGANKEDIITAQARYRITQDEYVKFSKAMEQPQQMERVYGDGLKGKIGNAQSYKVIENRANLYYNTGSTEENVKAYLKDETIRKNIRSNANKTLLIDKQAEHIKDSERYKEGNSYLIISNDEIQEIVNKYAGTGYIERNLKNDFNNKEVIILDKVVGVSINKNTKKEVISNRIKIHYRKTGVHVVPTLKGSEEK